MSKQTQSLWTLGGLSVVELVRRTAREAWQDDVFGQGGRMAFYQFLAIFPSLFLCFAIGLHTPHVREHLNDAFRDVATLLFPTEVARLFQSMLGEFNQKAQLGISVLWVFAGTVWATHNGTWAMIYGLNRAYEVEEQRSWWKLSLVISALTLCFVATAGCALTVMVFGAGMRAEHHGSPAVLHGLEWLVMGVAVLFSLGMFYRFAPNLKDQQWRWSTPGTLVALLLWLGATAATRLYFDHVNDYTRSYGHLNGVVMLLLWLFVANGAVLIGGEMNSEIQKAEASRGNSAPSGSGPQSRSGN